MSAVSRPMLTADKLRQFRADFETVRDAIPAAHLHLQHLDDAAKAAAGVESTGRSAKLCGEALKRMHDTESYRENYDSWAELCRALKINRQSSYRLMSLVGESPVEARMGIWEESTLEDRQEAVAGGDDMDATFERLRAKLQGSPTAKLDEGEQKKPKAVNDFAWVQRQVTTLQNWFDRRGMGRDVRELLNQVVEAARAAQE